MDVTVINNRSGICLENFNRMDQPFTYVSREGRDGFHGTRLAQWIDPNPTFQDDQQPVDPNSLISRTDGVMVRLWPALVNSACAALLGVVIAGAGVTVAAADSIKEGTLALATIVGGGTVETKVAIVEQIRGLGAAGAVAGVGAAITAIASGPIPAAITAVIVTAAAARTPISRSALATAGVIGVVGAGIDWILNSLGIDKIALESIGIGMFVGGLTLAGAALAEHVKLTPVKAIQATPLVASAAAGFYSLTRG